MVLDGREFVAADIARARVIELLLRQPAPHPDFR